nr:hypothetical protein [Tanacetum cinerariifolium]
MEVMKEIKLFSVYPELILLHTKQMCSAIIATRKAIMLVIVRNQKFVMLSISKKMLLAIKDEVGSHLSNEENDFVLDDAYGEESLDELTASIMLMAQLQLVNGTTDTTVRFVDDVIAKGVEICVLEEFVFIEPCHNQNYNENYYPHNSPSSLYCDNYGGPHESFQCQSMNPNYFEPNPCYDSKSPGFDQFQPLQYSDVHQSPKEISFDELKIMMQSYCERMNKQREQEALLVAQREQELLAQKQAAQEKEEPPQNFDFR